jgi:hypothetical protein
MPASRSYTTDDDHPVTIEIEGDLEPSRSPISDSKTVYFTDQSPTFRYTITNGSDEHIATQFRLHLSYQESDRDHEYGQSKTVNFDLDPGESTTGEFSTNMLPYQGTASVGVRTVFVRDNREEISFKKRDGIYQLYTFMVYDRDYYRVNYLRPRYAQYGAAILSALIVSLAAIQLYMNL